MSHTPTELQANPTACQLHNNSMELKLCDDEHHAQYIKLASSDKTITNTHESTEGIAMCFDGKYINNFHGDLWLVLKEYEKWGLGIGEFIRPEFQPYADDIIRLRGTQLNNFIGSICACAASLFAFSMNSALAAQCTSLSLELRATVAASPLLVGGFLRVFAAQQTDIGRGKENILELLGLSVLGMIGNILILKFMVENEDLSTITSANCWPLIMSGVFIGLGLGTYASGMTLGARTASNHSVDLWHDNLQDISKLLTTALRKAGKISPSDDIKISPGMMSHTISFILRKKAALYSAIIAGIANVSPSIPITINAYAEILSLSNISRTALFAGIQLSLMLGIYCLLNNPFYDQLRKNNKNLTHEQAKDIAMYAGQSLFANNGTLFDQIRHLTSQDKEELWAAIILYAASYGVLTAITTTGSYTLMSRCVSKIDASLTIARAITVSSICRAMPLLHPSFRSGTSTNPLFTPTHLNQGSLLIMSVALATFAFVDKENLPQSMIYLYAAFCGVVCFSVVARIVAQTPTKVGLITGASSGIGAFVGFPLSLLMVWMKKYNPEQGECSNGEKHQTISFQLLLPVAISFTTLAYISTPMIKRSISNLRQGSMFRPAETNPQNEHDGANELGLGGIEDGIEFKS